MTLRWARQVRLAVICVLTATLGACVVSIDEQTVFRPPHVAQKAAMPSDMRIAGQESLEARIEHDFVDAGALRIATTHVTPMRPERPDLLILVCMGNASDRIRNGAAYASRLLQHGDVILFDYPGYGDSTGTPTAANLLAVMEPVMRYAEEVAADRPILLWGHSLGGFICAEMVGSATKASGLVLETTAANAAEVARAWTPWFLPFLRVSVDDGLAGFDIPAVLNQFDAPVLVLGAARDRTLPVTLHRSLAEQLEAGGRRVTYIEYPAASHYGVPRQRGFGADTAGFFASVRGQAAPSTD